MTLRLARQLRDDFLRAREILQKSGVADFSRAEEAIRSLRKLDDQNGYGWYFDGEIKRINNNDRFTVKSCPKKLPIGEPVSLDTYRQDFYIYLEIERTLPASETGGDPGSEICYRQPKGYCVQRAAWINHLIANDFYEEAIAATHPADGATKLERAKEHARKARKYYREEGGKRREGFEQCTDTIALQGKIDERLKALRFQQ